MFAAMPEWLGTVPQWFSAMGLASIFGMLLAHSRGTKKLDLDGAANLRQHYDTELLRLQTRILDLEKVQVDRERDLDERWRKLLHDSEERNAEADRRHRECVDERDELKKSLEGLARQFAQFQRLTAQAIPPSEAVDDMLRRLEPYSGD